MKEDLPDNEEISTESQIATGQDASTNQIDEDQDDSIPEVENSACACYIR